MLEDKKAHRLFNDHVLPNLKSLENTAFRLTRDNHKAEDLLQETLFKAYKNFSQYAINTNFRAWIFKIMVNTYITGYRKMNKQPHMHSYNDLEEFYLYQKAESRESFVTEQNEDINGEYFHDEVYAALNKLPYYFRLVVLLYDIEGFSYQEISRIVDIPVGTVMSRLNRGRSLLRAKLKRYATVKGYIVNTEPEYAV